MIITIQCESTEDAKKLMEDLRKMIIDATTNPESQEDIMDMFDLNDTALAVRDDIKGTNVTMNIGYTKEYGHTIYILYCGEIEVISKKLEDYNMVSFYACN